LCFVATLALLLLQVSIALREVVHWRLCGRQLKDFLNGKEA
jgi:hypothetical protein